MTEQSMVKCADPIGVEHDSPAHQRVDWTGVASQVTDSIKRVALAHDLLEAELARVRQAIEHDVRSTDRDLTDRPRADGRQGLDESDVSPRHQPDFIANLAHEIRTPLNSLLLLAQQLEDNPDDNLTPKQVRYASVIRASGRELLGLVNAILDLAKIEAGGVDVEMSPVSLGDLRDTLLCEFEHIALDNGLDFSVRIDDGCPDRIVTDPRRLRQVLVNLLANAFKFTDDGEVRVEIAAAERGWPPANRSLAGSPAVLALSVRDTGIGIASDQQAWVFEAFAQADATTARRSSGTGLGLSISRELVGLLGGELVVRSAPGDGSTFTVYLPLLEASEGAEASTEPTMAPVAGHRDVRPDAGLAGATVLVVDDDYCNVFALSAVLERSRAEVVIAESGEEAIEILDSRHDIDLVLMDLVMPGMDGYETIRSIRERERYRDLPIIALSGTVVEGVRERSIESGADEHLPKPVDTADLLAVMRTWLPTIDLAAS